MIIVKEISLSLDSTHCVAISISNTTQKKVHCGKIQILKFWFGVWNEETEKYQWCESLSVQEYFGISFDWMKVAKILWHQYFRILYKVFICTKMVFTIFFLKEPLLDYCILLMWSYFVHNATNTISLYVPLNVLKQLKF